MDILYRLLEPFGGSVLVQCAAATLAVFALAGVLTPLVRDLSVRFGLLAPPHDHSLHSIPLSRLGGIAIYVSFTLGVLLFEPLAGGRLDLLSHEPVTTGHLLAQIRGLLLGGTVAVAIGLIDDLRQPRGLRPSFKFLGQVLAVATAFAAGLRPVQGIANPFAVTLFYAQPEKHKQIILWSTSNPQLWAPLLAMLFTAFWVVGMMNTVNFLDGLDGLASGVVMIAAILLAIWSSGVHKDVGGPIVASEVLLLLPLLLAAALLGFLLFNWYPASIHMGDSGAQFTGFAIGVLAVLGPAKIGTALLILAVPILDVAWVSVRRGRHFGTADLGHLHHQLLRLGFTQRRIVAFFYTLCIALGAIDLLLSRLAKLLVFLVVAILTALLLVRVARRRAPPLSTPRRSQPSMDAPRR